MGFFKKFWGIILDMIKNIWHEKIEDIKEQRELNKINKKEMKQELNKYKYQVNLENKKRIIKERYNPTQNKSVFGNNPTGTKQRSIFTEKTEQDKLAKRKQLYGY